MLGGDEERTLHMITAPVSDSVEAAAGPRGRIESLEVAAARAGYP
jgi:hypothetical protein